MDVWYFAYGSNLNKEQMKRRVGKWRDSTKAILRDHKLVFDIYSQSWKGGVADVVESPGGFVYGAVYLLTEDQIKELDKYEAVPTLYSKRKVNVEIDDKMQLDALAYVASNPGKFLKPSKEYLGSVMSGLRQHGYDEKIIKQIGRIAESAENTRERELSN